MMEEIDERISRMKNSLTILNELEERVDDEDAKPPVSAGSDAPAGASRNISSDGFDRDLRKAIEMISSIGVSQGYHNLAEDVLELGGDNV